MIQNGNAKRTKINYKFNLNLEIRPFNFFNKFYRKNYQKYAKTKPEPALFNKKFDTI